VLIGLFFAFVVLFLCGTLTQPNKVYLYIVMDKIKNNAQKFKDIRAFLPRGFAKIIMEKCEKKDVSLPSEKSVYNVFTQGTANVVLEDEILKLALSNKKRQEKTRTNWAVFRKEYKQAS